MTIEILSLSVASHRNINRYTNYQVIYQKIMT